MEALLSSLTVFINALVLHLYVCTACLCADLRQCISSTNVLAEALYEKKQSILNYDAEVAKLQEQVEKMESASAEKDAEYEAIVKKSEGEVI